MIQEYRRFTLEEVRDGAACGWTFSSGWFAFSQSAWAWFRREVAQLPGKSHEQIGTGSAPSKFEIPLVTVDVEMDPNLLGSEGPAVQSLSGDSFEQRKPSLPEELRSDLGRAVAEFQPGVDKPNSALVECGFDTDAERGMLAGSHRRTLALAAMEVKEG